MDDLEFLDGGIDLDDANVVSAYDELPLWSAMFGLLLLEHLPLGENLTVLDAGCGTGFPLIELAERLGPTSRVHGVDLWKAGLERARAKVASRGTANVVLHEGSALALPFDDSFFDLVVSNLGVNNFEDPDAALRECRRVARSGATLALTTNLRGHMAELYSELETVVAAIGDPAMKQRLEENVQHRATVATARGLLERAGFDVVRVVEREGVMRFASGNAFFRHHFIRLGFVDAWKRIFPAEEKRVFSDLIGRLDARARREGALTLTIPMAYLEAVAR